MLYGFLFQKVYQRWVGLQDGAGAENRKWSVLPRTRAQMERIN